MNLMKNLLFLFCISLSLGVLPLVAASTSAEIVTLPDEVSAQTKALNPSFVMFRSPQFKPGTQSPSIIFLHGGGGGRRPLTAFTNNHVASRIREFDMPFTVVVPQRTENKDAPGGWQPADLNLLLDYLIAKHSIDPTQIYLTGASMGGAGTWFWADKNPERFAAVVPISAGGQTGPKDKLIVDPESLKDLPIRAFHGTADKVCPPQQIEDLVNAIRKLDGDTTMTLYEGAGHGGIIERVYGNRKVFEWLLSHQRKKL